MQRKQLSLYIVSISHIIHVNVIGTSLIMVCKQYSTNFVKKKYSSPIISEMFWFWARIQNDRQWNLNRIHKCLKRRLCHRYIGKQLVFPTPYTDVIGISWPWFPYDFPHIWLSQVANFFPKKNIYATKSESDPQVFKKGDCVTDILVKLDLRWIDHDDGIVDSSAVIDFQCANNS